MQINYTADAFGSLIQLVNYIEAVNTKGAGLKWQSPARSFREVMPQTVHLLFNDWGREHLRSKVFVSFLFSFVFTGSDMQPGFFCVGVSVPMKNPLKLKDWEPFIINSTIWHRYAVLLCYAAYLRQKPYICASWTGLKWQSPVPTCTNHFCIISGSDATNCTFVI